LALSGLAAGFALFVTLTTLTTFDLCSGCFFGGRAFPGDLAEPFGLSAALVANRLLIISGEAAFVGLGST
jgi:hypothetical protein